ncbi:MAG: aldo/keto reductase [Piscirickettsiaceae bacterium]|nr:aldo/keto reductase [Piscirickettsiaceae bacterium]
MSLYLNQRKYIAQTGIAVSPLGLGTVKIGRNTAVKYPDSFKIPDDTQVQNLFTQAWDLGINLLDTAPAYGNSEQRLGHLLNKQANDWIIATKVGETFDADTGESHYDFSPEFITASIHQSLKNLKREVLDIVLIHSDGNDKQIIEQGALEVLADLKQQGLIRATGMSTKTVEGGLLALQQSDLAMVMHNLDYQQEQAVLDQATIDNKGIFIKKALASGHLTPDSAQENFNLIYSNPAVSSIIIGTINPKHLKDNVAKVSIALSTK